MNMGTYISIWENSEVEAPIGNTNRLEEIEQIEKLQNIPQRGDKEKET